jgi:hypothetical protein
VAVVGTCPSREGHDARAAFLARNPGANVPNHFIPVELVRGSEALAVVRDVRGWDAQFFNHLPFDVCDDFTHNRTPKKVVADDDALIARTTGRYFFYLFRFFVFFFFFLFPLF